MQTMSMPPAISFPARDKGWAFRWRGKLSAVVIAAAAVAPMISRPWAPHHPWLAELMSAAGVLCFLAGASLRFWSTLYLGGRKSKLVVDAGPYSVCRNPLYLGSVLIVCSTGLLLESLTFFVGVLAVTWMYAAATVPAEERFLESRFGEAYTDYCGRVPRFWPRLSLFRTPEQVTVSVDALRGECKRASRWIWIPILAGLVAQLRLADWWPQLLHLP